MLDINEFLEIYYDISGQDMMTLQDFEDLKEEKEIEEWDYPLEEYRHISDENIDAVPVRFLGNYGGYEYRFCEVTEKIELNKKDYTELMSSINKVCLNCPYLTEYNCNRCFVRKIADGMEEV